MIISIIAIIIFIMGFVIYSYLKKQIENYVQTINQNDLESIGVSAKSFIGLHIKSLENEAKLIYVRKTTPYKGIIVFIPERKFDFHFYLPWLIHLCRNGYIIVTYHTQKEVYASMPEELQMVLETIKKDEILNTYPISILAHGKSGYASLGLLDRLNEDIKLCFIGATCNEEASVFDFIQQKFSLNLSFFKKHIQKVFKKKYGLQKDLNLNGNHHDILMILGKEDENLSKLAPFFHLDHPQLHLEMIENKKNFPFLSKESEAKINQLLKTLKDPQLSQFEYNKLLEDFDLTLLYDIDQTVLDAIIQFLEA